MALLDSISLFSNSTVIAKWANGKLGEIIPTDHSTYIFVEHVEIDGELDLKYKIEERDEKSPVLAYGFVYYWLRYRKRKSLRAQRLTSVFAPSHEGKTPKEIFDLYIDARKTWFLDTMSNRPDAWRYPDHEKMFYEHNLTREGEEELILKSEPLLDYLDEEDKDEFIDVMKNFLGYVASIVEPYQHVMEEAARQKRIEQNNESFTAFSQRAQAQEELDEKWPNPVRKEDNKKYNIDSPEILEYANSLTPLQVEILEQLIANQCQIYTWQENLTLNLYSQEEIWEATCPLFVENIILATIDCGHVFGLEIEDKGKLVLRKYKSLQANKDVKKRSSTKKEKKDKDKDVKGKTEKKKTVTTIEPYPTFNYNYPRNTDSDKLHFAHRIISVQNRLVKWKWIPKETSIDSVYDLYTGTKSTNLIHWNLSPGVLAYLFRQLCDRNIITIPEDNDGANMWDILSMHMLDKDDYHIDKDRLSSDGYREPKRQIKKINIIIGLLDPTNIESDNIEEEDNKEIH